jgi:DNA-binding winged helix-turn-helix (wHTH) protein
VPICFEEFVFDRDARQLTRTGQVVHLTPKQFDLLAILVDERPRAIPKAELRDRLWPSTFVSDAALSVLVAGLRRALGEPDRAEQIVRTVQGFGYAFGGGMADTPQAGEADAVYALVWGRRVVKLSRGEHIVGRDRAAAIQIDDATVSRRHASITISADAVLLEDLHSKNGTFVGGERLTGPTALNDGDQIRFGSVLVRIRAVGGGGSTETLIDRRGATARSAGRPPASSPRR